MIRFKTVGLSLVASTLFAAAGCLAQQGNAYRAPGPSIWPVTSETQLKRCQDIGRFVKEAAVARDAGESEQQFIGRHGLNMSPAGGIGLIHQRLPVNTRLAGGYALLNSIFASSASPANWQMQLLAACEKNIR